jgi:hypothetical protein
VLPFQPLLHVAKSIPVQVQPEKVKILQDLRISQQQFKL